MFSSVVSEECSVSYQRESRIIYSVDVIAFIDNLRGRMLEMRDRLLPGCLRGIAVLFGRFSKESTLLAMKLACVYGLLQIKDKLTTPQLQH